MCHGKARTGSGKVWNGRLGLEWFGIMWRGRSRFGMERQAWCVRAMHGSDRFGMAGKDF